MSTKKEEKERKKAEALKKDEDQLQKMREMMFGKWDGEYIGNMWGWKLSIISFFVLLTLSILIYIGHQKGIINVYDQDYSNIRREVNVDTLDSLNIVNDPKQEMNVEPVDSLK